MYLFYGPTSGVVSSLVAGPFPLNVAALNTAIAAPIVISPKIVISVTNRAFRQVNRFIPTAAIQAVMQNMLAQTAPGMLGVPDRDTEAQVGWRTLITRSCSNNSK